MDAQQIRKLKPKLRRFLKRFDEWFPRKDTRAHLPVYISGQLSDIPEKSVEPIAINAGVPPEPCKSSSASTTGIMTGRATSSSTSSVMSTLARTRLASLTRRVTSRRETRPPA